MSSTCLNDLLLNSTIYSGPPIPPQMPPFSSNLLLFLPSIKTVKEPPLKVDEIIEDACKRFISLFAPLKKNSSMTLLSLNNHCDPVIQSGPTCGLVALIMCLKLINNQIEINLPTILNKAQSYGYTRLGEMFSAQNMSDFIRNEFLLKCELKHDMDRSMLDIVKHLCQGLPILIPYDADSNYEPCLKEGTRAHWAIICGFCIVNPLDKNVGERNQQQIQFEKIVDLNKETSLCHISSKDQGWQKIFDYIKRYLSCDRLFVYARQGKSRYIQIWNYRKLCQSNQNLNKVSSKILKDPERVDMVYPKDGKLDESLSNKFIMFYR